MKTHTSKKAILARGLLILPLISLLFFSFSNKEIVEKEINIVPADTMNTTTLLLEVDNNGKVYFQKNETNLGELRKHINNSSYISYHIEVAENTPSSIMIDLRQIMAENRIAGSVAICTTSETAQDKATPEMIEEYNRLVKLYNGIPQEEFEMEQKVINRIMYIRSLMTPEQKEKAEKITFDVPPPPPPAPSLPELPAPPPPPAANKDGVKVPPAPPAPVMGNMQAPPPPPPSPIESVKDWIEEGAEFFYNGKKTTGQNVLEIVQKNGGKNLEVRVEENTTGKTVKISDKKSPNHNPPTSSRDGLKILPPPPVPAKVNKQVPSSPYNLSTASQQTTEKLRLLITSKIVIVNGKETNVRGVAKLVDETTSDWTIADFNLHGLEIKVAEDVSKDLINRLNVELQKTRLVKSLNSGSAYVPYPNTSRKPPSAPVIEDYLTEDSMIYMDGKIISAETALSLLRTKRDKLKVSIHQNGEENTVITMEQT